MKPHELHAYRNANKELAGSAFSRYVNMIQLLCKNHQGNLSADTVSSLVREKDWLGLLSYADSLSSAVHDDATQHFVANQFAALIRKYPWPKDLISLDPEAAALKKFWAAEHKCKWVNRRFRCYEKRSPYEAQLQRMRQFIRYVIGDAPNLRSIWENCDFSGGASIGVHGNATNLARKVLSDKWSVSAECFHYGYAAMSSHAQLQELLLQEGDRDTYIDNTAMRNNFAKRVTMVTYNKIAFVPKTAKVHRTIAVEPLINGFVQKGIDIVLRRKLKRVGIDLSDQSRNQLFAAFGSMLWDNASGFATLDLSSASDSVAIEVVRNLLPPEWFAFLNATRSKQFKLDRGLYTYHKFCSMGNGFCFPLESLIFAAVCVACDCGVPGEDFAVYGDDIIVKRDRSAAVVSLLGVCGFSLNLDKSFVEGPFRESCGADWFKGDNVRPITLDYGLDSIENIIKFSNLTISSERVSMFFREVRASIYEALPIRYRFVRPLPGVVDAAVQVELDEFMSSPHAFWNPGLQCWSWKELCVSASPDMGARTHGRYSLVLLMGALAGSSSSAPFTLRRKPRTKVRRMSYSGALAFGATVPG